MKSRGGVELPVLQPMQTCGKCHSTNANVHEERTKEKNATLGYATNQAKYRLLSHPFVFCGYSLLPVSTSQNRQYNSMKKERKKGCLSECMAVSELRYESKPRLGTASASP